MARIGLVEPEQATGPASELLGGVKKKLGLVPNMTKALANSPAALESYVAFSGAMAKAKLPAKVREQIAILTAERNACTYCLSAHTMIGQKLGLSAEEAERARDGSSEDAKAEAALRFASRVLETSGGVSEADVRAVREAGYGDGEIAEIIAAVALNVFTNYVNVGLAVDVDFPRVEARRREG